MLNAGMPPMPVWPEEIQIAEQEIERDTPRQRAQRQIRPGKP
jgi:hypothetical protein